MPLEIVRNDITKMKVDAIVNPTNEYLRPGGGVDAAVHAAAGPRMDAACAKLASCLPGEVRLTRGYKLPCKWVIHTVGPVWRGGGQGEAETLSRCVTNALALAQKQKCASVALPVISAGSYGYPKDQALSVVTSAIRAALQRYDCRVSLVVYDVESFRISLGRFREVAQFVDDRYVSEHPYGRTLRFRQERPPEPPVGAAQPAFDMDEESAQPSLRMSESAGHAPLEDYADIDAYLSSRLDEGFTDMLLRKIDASGMTDAQCYKRANIDRKLFSKIRGNPRYRPSKPTVLAFAAALKLSLAETRVLLAKAGFALSDSSRFDLIVEYCFREGIYDVFEINEILFAFDQPILGGA